MNKYWNRSIRITITAVFLGLNIALSSFGLTVPGGHLYLNDVVIALASILLNPIEAFLVGGIGSFLGDLFFYPTPMFVSLVTHGLQAVVISLFSHYVLKKHRVISSGIAVFLGAIIMIVGYTIGRAFIYATPEAAMLKLPFQILQASVGAVSAMVIAFAFRIDYLFNKYIERYTVKETDENDWFGSVIF